MKYSDHPMPLVEGEVPWEQVMVLDTNTNKFKLQWRQLEPEEREYLRWEGNAPETDTYELEEKDEFYDFITYCKACNTEFIAYGTQRLIRNYCPGCGRQLVKQEAEDEQARAESGE